MGEWAVYAIGLLILIEEYIVGVNGNHSTVIQPIFGHFSD
jgi:hypothetical protein